MHPRTALFVKSVSCLVYPAHVVTLNKIPLKKLQLCATKFLHSGFTKYAVPGIQENITALQIKKRPVRKKKSVVEEEVKLSGVSFSFLAVSFIA